MLWHVADDWCWFCPLATWRTGQFRAGSTDNLWAVWSSGECSWRLLSSTRSSRHSYRHFSRFASVFVTLCGIRLIFGRPLQVMVHPVLWDCCPVCLCVMLVYYGQTVGWIKMPLCTEVGLGPGDILLDGHPAPLPHFLAHVCCGQTVAHLSWVLVSLTVSNCCYKYAHVRWFALIWCAFCWLAYWLWRA